MTTGVSTMRATKDALSEPGDVARLLGNALPGTITLCEPYFGGASLVLSPHTSWLKVRVINDPAQGLVKLFEMVRVDRQLLRDIMIHGKADLALPAYSTRSPFVRCVDDVVTGIAALRSCLVNLSIDEAGTLASERGFDVAIKAVHEKLEPVLIENMPVREFFTRFDKQYVAFFVPDVTHGIQWSLPSVPAVPHELRGVLIVEVKDDIDDMGQGEALAASFAMPPLKVSRSIVVQASLGRERHFLVFKGRD